MTFDLISCDQYFSALPWPEIAVVGPFSFTLGALLGLAYGRRHPRPSRDQKGTHDD